MAKYTLDELLDKLWEDYTSTNPAAQRIHDLFVARGEQVVNDHIAFRTFNHPSIGVDVLGYVFQSLGYAQKGEYHFKEKKLYARHYEHERTDVPLIFISELKMEDLDDESRQTVQELINQVPPGFASGHDFIFSGRPWDVTQEMYQKLKRKSEYAAWMAAFGFRVNHFTVSVNHLNNFNTLFEVNRLLKENGFELNESGGEIKGSPEVYLEQSSTIASNVKVDFSDGAQYIPGCYYEFARRFPMPDGRLFRGFVTGSADKIFESTNKGQ